MSLSNQTFLVRVIQRVAIATTALLFSAIAAAEAPSFTYVELEYLASGDFEISDGSLSADVDMDGFAISGSVQLGAFLLQASRFELESETLFDSKLEDNISTLAVGLTFAFPQTAIYGLVRARRDELSIGGTIGEFVDDELDETSVGLEAGVRFNLTDRFELNANFGSPALDEGTSFGVGALFHVTDNLGIGVRYSSIEVEDDELTADLQTTSASLRYTF